jgi:hypothetical protein
VHFRSRGAVGQRSNHMLRRSDLRIAAAQIDEWFAALGCCGRDAREQRGEVLLGKTLQALWARLAHPTTLSGGALRASQLDR